MDAIQLIVDRLRDNHGYTRIYDDFSREESFAAKLREHVNAQYSRAEVSSNFVTLMDGNDGCAFHKDEKNCSKPGYDWTCCMVITVESASTHRLYRAVTNLNSRAACGRSLDNESTKLSIFKLGLEIKMERINSSYRGIYADRPWKEPTATEYTNLYLNDDLVWENIIDAQGKEWRYIRAATAATQDFFCLLHHR